MVQIDRAGYNVGPNVNKDKWYDFCRRSQINGALIISNFEVAVETYIIIRARTPVEQGVYVTVRHYYEGEESGWWKRDGESEVAYLNRLEAFRNGLFNLGHHPEIFHCLNNEPSLQNRDGRRLPDLLKYQVYMMNLLGEAGINFVAGHWSTGNWKAADIRNGIYVEHYDTLHYWNDRGLGCDSQHEYFPLHLPAQFTAGWTPGDWLNYDRWRPEVWPDPTQIPLEDPFDITDEQLKERSLDDWLRHYLLRRNDWFTAYQIRRYGKVARTLITEWGFDDVGNWQGMTDTIKQQYKPADMDFRGPPAYRRFWTTKAFPYWTFDETLYHQTQFGQRLYFDHVKSIYRFAYDQWKKEGCDYGELMSYQEMQINNPHWHEPLPVIPKPLPPPEPPPIVVIPPVQPPIEPEPELPPVIEPPIVEPDGPEPLPTVPKAIPTWFVIFAVGTIVLMGILAYLARTAQ